MENTDKQLEYKKIAERALALKKDAELARLFSIFSREVNSHTSGEVFYKIRRLFPNEHQESMLNRLISFEPITMATINIAGRDVKKTIKGSSYTIEASEKVIEFANQKIFNRTNLYTHILDKSVDVNILRDPNAIIACYPPEFENPVRFIEWQHIIHRSKEGGLLFISEHDSEVTYDEGASLSLNSRRYDKNLGWEISDQKLEGFSTESAQNIKNPVYHYFIDNFLYVIEREEGVKEYSVTAYPTPEKPYTSGLGFLVNDKMNLYRSFFSHAVPYGNLAIIQHSQHTAVNLNFAFPRMSELVDSCDECDGDMYEECEPCDEYPNGKIPCAKCKGTGNLGMQNVNKLYQQVYDPGTEALDQLSKDAHPARVRFYQPPSDTLEYSKNEWRDYENMFAERLFVKRKIETTKIQSADSKTKDDEAKYNFIRPISDDCLERKEEVLNIYEQYFETGFTANIEKPVSFNILSEDDAFAELKLLLESDTLEVFKMKQFENYLTKYVSNSSAIYKIFRLLQHYDWLLFKSTTEVENLYRNNLITREQWHKHAFGLQAITMIYQNADSDLTDYADDKLNKLIDEALPELPEAEKGLKEKLLDTV